MLLGEEFGKKKNLFPPARPWKEFFAKFTLPNKVNDLAERFELNIIYYQTNYLIISAFSFLVACCSAPLLLVIFGIILGLWYYIFRCGGEFRAGNFRLARQPTLIITSVIMLLVLVLNIRTLLESLYKVSVISAVCAIICLLHACFRSRSLKVRAQKLKNEIRHEFDTLLGTPGYRPMPSLVDSVTEALADREQEVQRRRTQDVVQRNRDTAQRIREKYGLPSRGASFSKQQQ